MTQATVVDLRGVEIKPGMPVTYFRFSGQEIENCLVLAVMPGLPMAVQIVEMGEPVVGITEGFWVEASQVRVEDAEEEEAPPSDATRETIVQQLANSIKSARINAQFGTDYQQFDTGYEFGILDVAQALGYERNDIRERALRLLAVGA